MSGLDEAEYLKLSAAVEAVEKYLGSGSAATASPSMLGDFLRNAKARMEQLVEGRLVFADSDRKESEMLVLGTIAVLMEREAILTAAERQQYGDFLSKDFFTRSDFGALDLFYSSAWDRLSDGGKAEMSHRVWGGIRQGLFDFENLPENVRKKEAERLYELMIDSSKMPESLRNIPEKDRADFIKAYNSGDQTKIDETLSRDSFKENVSKESSSKDQEAGQTIGEDVFAELDALPPNALLTDGSNGHER